MQKTFKLCQCFGKQLIHQVAVDS